MSTTDGVTGSLINATTTGSSTGTGSTTGWTNTSGTVSTTGAIAISTDDGHQNQVVTVFLTIIGVFALLGICTKLLHTYANWRKTPWYALVTTWANWFMAVSIVLLIPVDVSSSLHATCLEAAAQSSVDGNYSEDCEEPWVHFDREGLIVIWNIIYWVTYVECWVIVPVMQSYVLAGHFHWHQRMIRAVKENALIYAAGAVIGIILVLFIVAKEGIRDPQVLIGIAMAASNAYGLIIVIALLGYGLVEVPKKIWRKTDREGTMRYYRYKAYLHLEQYEQAEKELQTTMKLVKRYDDAIKIGEEFRPYMDIVISKCPLQYKDITRGEGDLVLEYGKIVSLHNRIIAALHNFNVSRSLYEMNLNRSWALDDVIRCEASRTRTIDWTFKQKKYPAAIASQMQTLEWYWKCHFEVWGYRALWVLAVLLSVSVIWSETLIVASKKVKLSIFYWLIVGGGNIPYAVQWFFVFVPVAYISYTAYWSLFQLRIFNFYRIVPKNSDANSLLFSAYYLARIIPSMTYNFLFMIDTDISAFEKVLGQIKLTLLGYELNFFFPVFLFLLCIGNYFDLYSKFFYSCASMFSCCWKINRYDFEEDWNDARIDKGKEIIAREREYKKRGQGLSIDQGINLLRTSPTEKVTKAASSVLSKFSFGRKKTQERGELVELEEV